MPKPLTVNEAAAQMGVTGELLREALKQGKFPFGVAVKMEKRWAYYINPATFDLYLRGELVELHANWSSCTRAAPTRGGDPYANTNLAPRTRCRA